MQSAPRNCHSRLPLRLGLLGAASCAALNAVVVYQLCFPADYSGALRNKASFTDNPQVTAVELELPHVFVRQPCGITLPLKNCGDTDLQLNRVIVGCACMDADVKPHILRSQKTGTLKLTFRGAERVGPFGQRVNLLFGSDSAPETTIAVFAKGTATNWAEVNPSVVNFGQITIGQATEAILRVRPLVKGTVSIRALSQHLTVSQLGISASPRDGSSEYRLHLNADPRASFGQCRDTLELTVAAEGFRPLEIPVFYQFKPCVLATPERIVLADIPQHLPTVRFVDLSSADAGVPLVEPIVSHSLGKTLECRCQRSGRGLRLRVEFRPQPERHFWSGAISLQFGTCALSLPFVARVKDTQLVPHASAGNLRGPHGS